MTLPAGAWTRWPLSGRSRSAVPSGRLWLCWRSWELRPRRKRGYARCCGGRLGCAWEGCALLPRRAGRGGPLCLLSQSVLSEQGRGLVSLPYVGSGCWGEEEGARCSPALLPAWAAACPGCRRWRRAVPGRGLHLVLPQSRRLRRGHVHRCCRVSNGAEEMLIIRELFHLAGAGTTRSSSWKLKLA